MTILYTVQRYEAWENSQKVGYLEGNQKYVDDFLNDSYQWMINQMLKRLSNYNGEYPIWLWKEEPEKVEITRYFDKGEFGCLLKVDLDTSQYLESALEAWDFVLNKWYLSMTDEEEGCPLEQSWERIFDVDEFPKNPYWWGKINVQCTTGRIPLEKIELLYTFEGDYN